MSTYPARLAVLAPTFMTAHDNKADNPKRQHTYLLGYSLLSVVRDGDAFAFIERRRLGNKPTDSLDLLIALGKDLDPEASLAGQRLDHIVSLIIRTPVGEAREADGIAPLTKLRDVLRNEVIDVDWYCDRAQERTPEGLAERFALEPCFGEDGERNPLRLALMLSSRAQAIWLAIAHELLPTDTLLPALYAYADWRTEHSIA